MNSNSADQTTRLGTRLLPYVWAIAAVSIAVVLRAAMTPILGNSFPFITMFPAVFVTSFLGGFWPAFLATVLSLMFALYLFIEPGASLSLMNPGDQLGMAFYVLSGLATGWLGEMRLRAQRRETNITRFVRLETERAEEEAIRAEEEAARAEEEAARAEEEKIRAEEQTARAEREARRATGESERTEEILASITDAFMVLDPGWTITHMNNRAAALAGGTPADFIGQNYWEAFPEAIGGPFETAFRRAMGADEVVRVEDYFLPVRKWLHATIYPYGSGLTVVSQDVTERVEAQRDTAFLAAIVASSEDAIVGKTFDGRVTSWNAAAERIFGYTAAEMIGRSIYTLIPPELHLREGEVLALVSSGEAVRLDETERVRKDGERILIAVTVSPIRDRGNKLVGVSSIMRDITAIKRTQMALAAESARSRELAQALDAALVIVRDMEGRITYWSRGASQLYGWSSAEAIGSRADELLQTQYPAPLDQIHAELVKTGKWQGELIYLSKDGRRLILACQWVLQLDHASCPKAVIEVNTDMTAQRHIDDRIRQTERLEVVGQLAGGVAHEANNQMTVVLGAADFVLRRDDLPAVVRNDIEHIRLAAERTAAITAQLLAFSRRQLFRPEALELDQLVMGLEDVLRRTVGERISLTLQLGTAGAKVRADAGQITQVLLNLTLNARDAMPGGGRITIETAVREQGERDSNRHPGVDFRRGKYVVLMVSDTGHGMTQETLRHAFEPFYTTKPVGLGTGLGLATVYGIVKQSGGYVWAYSEPGQGAVFKVYLPLEQRAGGEQPPPQPPPQRGAGQAILLVEDEAGVRYTTARALREHGYAVMEAANSGEALDLLQQRETPLDLLITDVIMPGGDGPGLAREVSQLKPGVAVLYISGYTDHEIQRRCLLASGEPFLQKPFTPETILRRVGELLDGKPTGIP